MWQAPPSGPCPVRHAPEPFIGRAGPGLDRFQGFAAAGGGARRRSERQLHTSVTDAIAQPTACPGGRAMSELLALLEGESHPEAQPAPGPDEDAGPEADWYLLWHREGRALLLSDRGHFMVCPRV